ncbi:hypothetical protein [Actinoallomurus sp. CA-142502]|uniref:hypothetical protein n=1 Tax=Actinoallomurus sp. CA-142502 TaxID=3239885 RepID=UPI003D8E270C
MTTIPTPGATTAHAPGTRPPAALPAAGGRPRRRRAGTATTKTTCGTLGCNRVLTPQDRRGRCNACYNRRRRMGLCGWVTDTDEIRARIQRLRDMGWTWRQIAEAAGVSPNVPIFLATGRTQRLWPESAEALLSVPLTPPPDNRRGIDSTGSRRRVQALAWMGWPAEEVARRAGTTKSTLATEILPSRQISVALARRINAVYRELSARPGPSKSAAVKARSLGHAPPAAWDDDRIDDPRHRPRGVRRPGDDAPDPGA